MTVIEFKNVSKHFKIYQNRSYSIKEKFINKVLSRNKLEVKEFSVLEDASFQIKQGETIGIIGENGTGKSTTLKLISKILYPDKGEIEVKGKVSALLEIGAGFQPDLTGRENVYLYGSILGLSKEEISRQYDSIVEFSELSNFMDMPVKNYSSGMYMRLAFAVAINVDPDILLIDEVLAVGDENFQKKCIDKILSFKRDGKTIVFVSHDMSTVRKICDRVFFIKRGGIMLEGTPEQMIGLYMKLVYSNDEDKVQVEQEINEMKGKGFEIKEVDYNLDIHEAQEYVGTNRFGNKKLEITKVFFSDSSGHVRNNFYPGESISVNVEFKKNKEVSDAVFGFAIYSEEDWHLVGHNCKNDGLIITDIKENNHIKLTIRNQRFLKGKYYFTAALHNSDETDQYDFRERHFYFQIIQDERTDTGKIRVDCDWNL
ncbi:ABC transporter ATP-binding protein [Clostridium polynesiense]|uniref:ABC transporter ATP-binding protein n=1 Tax=Clostridium polynesiense TaxID=1325933 RepID=UPI00058AE0A3|nr:ABC transporter ATP-binding protein [Clostridium polynesiense]